MKNAKLNQILISLKVVQDDQNCSNQCILESFESITAKSKDATIAINQKIFYHDQCAGVLKTLEKYLEIFQNKKSAIQKNLEHASRSIEYFCINKEIRKSPGLNPYILN